MKKIMIVYIISASLLLSGCGRELNTLAISISLGIDKTEDGYLITYQILNPRVIASKKNFNEAPVILYSETGKDIFETFRKIATISPRKVFNSHLRVIVFGEEVAKEGIQELLDFFVRDHEYRTDFYFFVAKGTTANKILSVLTPFEIVPGMEIYQSMESSEDALATTKKVEIFDLINSIISDGKNPVLTSIEIQEKTGKHDTFDELKNIDPDKLKLSGLGAFKKDKLAGWLNFEESKGYNYITGNVENTVEYITYEDEQITFEITGLKEKTTADMLNGKPSITVEMEIKANIAAETGTFDVSNEDNINKLSNSMQNKIIGISNDALKKAQKDFGTDIFGFGDVIHRTYPKSWENLKENWNKEFINLPVKISAKVKVQSLGENTKSFFSKGTNN